MIWTAILHRNAPADQPLDFVKHLTAVHFRDDESGEALARSEFAQALFRERPNDLRPQQPGADTLLAVTLATHPLANTNLAFAMVLGAIGVLGMVAVLTINVFMTQGAFEESGLKAQVRATEAAQQRAQQLHLRQHRRLLPAELSRRPDVGAVRIGLIGAAVSNYNNLRIPAMALPAISVEGERVGVDILGGPSVGNLHGLITANLKFRL